jgi:hypothetical protein
MGMPAAAPAQQPVAADPYSHPGYAPPPFIPPSAFVPPPQSGRSSGAVAFILGLFPGLGAVYNGEYNKALIHIVIFASIIFGLTSDLSDGVMVVLSLLLAGFVFYMAFDSMRTAQAKIAGIPSTDPLEHWSRGKPIGPMILIGLGALFLLNNFHFFDFFRIRLDRMWPLVMIGVGILMFRNRVGRH